MKNLKLKTLLNENIKPTQVKPGYIYSIQVEDIDKPGKWHNSNGISIFKNTHEIHFFLINEFPRFDKINMKKILALVPKQYIDDRGYAVDKNISNNIVVYTILYDGSLTSEAGTKVEIVKKIGKI